MSQSAILEAAVRLGANVHRLADLQPNQILRVRTKSGSEYLFRRDADGKIHHKGGKYFPEWVEAQYLGAEVGYPKYYDPEIVVEMLWMAFQHPNYTPNFDKIIKTTRIVEANVEEE